MSFWYYLLNFCIDRFIIWLFAFFQGQFNQTLFKSFPLAILFMEWRLNYFFSFIFWCVRAANISWASLATIDNITRADMFWRVFNDSIFNAMFAFVPAYIALRFGPPTGTRDRTLFIIFVRYTGFFVFLYILLQIFVELRNFGWNGCQLGGVVLDLTSQLLLKLSDEFVRAFLRRLDLILYHLVLVRVLIQLETSDVLDELA